MKHITDYINESKAVTVAEIQKWASKAVAELQNGSDACYYHLLGNSNCKTGKMYLVIGWNDGFEKQTKEENPNADGEWRICTKLAYNCDDLQHDYRSDWEMPYNEETGDVDDTDSEYDNTNIKHLYDHWKKNYAK